MEKRTSYPVPDGYRMLQPGEIIKENDLCWFADKFQQVPHTSEYTGAADPAKHACIIRADSSYLYGHGQPAEEKRSDLIKPDYYQTDSVYEPFKIIRHYGLNFFEGNVLKYLLRAGKKSSKTRLEDLRKANTYLASEIEQTKQDGEK